MYGARFFGRDVRKIFKGAYILNEGLTKESAEQAIPKKVDDGVITACVAVMHVVQIAVPTKPTGTLQPCVMEVVVLVNIGVGTEGGEECRREAHEWDQRQHQAQKRGYPAGRYRIVRRQAALDGAVL